jgi:hypothetical protein
VKSPATIILPSLQTGSVNRAERCHHQAGGKGVNVSARLGEFGISTTATGFLGAENQTHFTTLFSQLPIRDAFVRISGRTRTGIKFVERNGEVTTEDRQRRVNTFQEETGFDVMLLSPKAGGVCNGHASGRHRRHHAQQVGVAAAASAVVATVLLHLQAQRPTGDAVLLQQGGGSGALRMAG